MAAHPQLSSEGIILSLSQQEAKLDKAGIPSFVISSCDDCGGLVGSMFRTHIHTWLATQCWAITLTTELLLGVPCFSWSALKYFHLSCMIYAYWRRFDREAVGNHNLLE